MTNITDAMRLWIAQKPRLEYGNYADLHRPDPAGRASYFVEVRRITLDLAQARALLAYVEANHVPADYIATACGRAFSGRLSWDGSKLDYTTGQYWPTEYRAAACSVLASAIWQWQADSLPDDCADIIRRTARAKFGRAIASRWFN